MVTPARIELARRRRGLTKTALAKRVGVTTRSITAFEAGDIQPSESTLERLARTLDFPPEFFLAPELDEVAEGTASFRALSKMTAAQRNAAFGAGALAFELSDWIGERFRLPSVTVPKLGPNTDAETAASVVRAEWGLGDEPAPNLIHLLERHGVRVFSLAEDCLEVDAFSLWRRGVPFVFLNTKKTSEHSRFDAAHELGHLVLHSHHELPQGRPAEAEANQFAAAFLMPRTRLLASVPHGAGLRDLLKLKKPLKVSVAALAHRLHSVGLLTEWNYRTLCIDISKRGYRRNEPEGIPRETSQILNKVFAALRAEGLKKSDIAATLNLYPGDLDALVFGLAMLQMDGGGSAPGPRSQREDLELIEGGG